MEGQTAELVAECKRQEESCLYTSTTIFEWLKELRFWRIGFVVVPIVLASLATWEALADQAGWEWVTATCALLAGIIPAIYKALDFDVNLAALAADAHEFKTLQDRFRQAAAVTSLGQAGSLEADFTRLMDRMDAVRAHSLTPPERFFKKAQAKIAKGDYQFAVDKEPRPQPH